MNRKRREEILLSKMACLLKHFTLTEEERNEYCRFCSDVIHCETTWRPTLEREIKEILDYEFKPKVGKEILFLSGEFKGQKGKITQIGAEHNPGFYCFVMRPDGKEERFLYPEDIEILN